MEEEELRIIITKIIQIGNLIATDRKKELWKSFFSFSPLIEIKYANKVSKKKKPIVIQIWSWITEFLSIFRENAKAEIITVIPERL
ncbi:MAG: hypothetical protein K2X86_18595 [Cytophagaceae bacterium]|nr:hypothetical protein [Cytophagaceae bacterium]